MNTKISIHSVTTPSDAQKNSGILGTVQLDIIDPNDNRVFFSLPGIMVRKSKKGDRFLSPPSKKVGDGKEARYFNYFNVFPLKRTSRESDPSITQYNEEQKANMSKLTQEVLRILDNGGTRQTANTSTTESTTVSASDWM